MTPAPEWIATLSDEIASRMHPNEMLPPIGCHYHEADGVWEVTIFASATEILGGAYDGRVCPSRFMLDVSSLTELFDSVDRFYWQPLPMGEDDELGSNLSIEGVLDGRRVWLRILATAPEQFETGRYANLYEMRFEEAW